jgi:hypothetical protein
MRNREIHMESVFKYAGVSFHNDKFKFRATNRDGYGDILVKEGKTYVKILELPQPMAKDEAKAYLATHPEFKDAGSAVMAVLVGKEKVERALKGPKGPKAAKPVKAAKKETTKAPKAPKAVISTDDLEAIREKNLETIRQVASSTKRAIEEDNRKAKAEAELAQIEADLDREDPKEFIPKFLHKELGLQ